MKGKQTPQYGRPAISGLAEAGRRRTASPPLGQNLPDRNLRARIPRIPFF